MDLTTLGSDHSVQDLGEIWGNRSPIRRTRGQPPRSLAYAALHILGTELGFRECSILGEVLSDAWGGEDGWETNALIRGIGAAKAQPSFNEERRRGEHP